MRSLNYLLFFIFLINQIQLILTQINRPGYLSLDIKNKIDECNGTVEFYDINKLICSPCPPNSFSSDSKYIISVRSCWIYSIYLCISSLFKKSSIVNVTQLTSLQKIMEAIKSNV